MLRNITGILRFSFDLRQNKGLALFFVTELNNNSVFTGVARKETWIPQVNHPRIF
jgi:hypothetical protein